MAMSLSSSATATCFRSSIFFPITASLIPSAANAFISSLPKAFKPAKNYFDNVFGSKNLTLASLPSDTDVTLYHVREHTRVRFHRRDESAFAIEIVCPDADIDGRSWRASITLHPVDGGYRLDTQVTLNDHPHETAPISEPPAELLAGFHALLDVLTPHRADGIPISKRPIAVTTETYTHTLAELLQNVDREIPAFVIWEPWSADALSLAKTLYGVAYVITITKGTSLTLRDLIGERYNVYNGSARLYTWPFHGGNHFVFKPEPLMAANGTQNVLRRVYLETHARSHATSIVSFDTFATAMEFLRPTPSEVPVAPTSSEASTPAPPTVTDESEEPSLATPVRAPINSFPAWTLSKKPCSP